MDDQPQQVMGESSCRECSTPYDVGLIFCTKCGAALRPPIPLIEPSLDDTPPTHPIRLIIRIFLTIIRVVAGIAAVVAIFCPLSTFTMILVFLGSLAVFLICHMALAEWDDNYSFDNLKEGYWPQKPMDWNPVPTEQKATKKHAEKNN